MGLHLREIPQVVTGSLGCAVSYAERMFAARKITRWVAVVLPDPAARAVWWLVAALMGAYAFFGPIISASIYFGVYGTRFFYSWPRLLLANGLAVICALAIMMFLLRRHRQGAISLTAMLGYSVLVSAVIAFGRLIVLIPFDFVPDDEGNVFGFFAINLSIVFLLFSIMAIASWYANAREQALLASFVELNRSQRALLQEEEAVRNTVFDQLHGTVQSEVVAIRQQLQRLPTDDPALRVEIDMIDQRLRELNREGIQAVARALSPQGLDAGLVPALRELRVRIEGAMEMTLSIDPVVLAMDDPVGEGLNLPVRTAAFRIVEEAVSNALRHAHAPLIQVSIGSRLAGDGTELVLDIRHQMARSVSIVEGEGLRRMRSRAQALNGDAGWYCRDGVFAVVARLPLARSDDAAVLIERLK